MPTVVSEFPRGPLHSTMCERYLDGRVWKFTKSDLRTFRLHSWGLLRSKLNGQALKVRGRRIRTSLKDEALYVQAIHAKAKAEQVVKSGKAKR